MNVEKILVVDDVPDNLKLLEADLEDFGYEVATAMDGNQALQVFERTHPDLVLLDIRMPGLSGLEVLAKLRERHSVSDLPVIMTTAVSESEDIVTALKNGANDYVTKPLDVEVLMARVETQLKLLRLKREKDRLDRVKDDFLAIASHDLKNPLFVISAAITLISEHAPPGSQMTDDIFEFVSLIKERTSEMTRIIEDFLDFQALEEGRLRLDMESIDLHALMAKAMENNAARAEIKAIHVELQKTEGLPAIQVDPHRIAQILDNLLSNAIKFSDEKGSIVLRSKLEGGKAVIEVSDAGPGLTKADMRKVFGKYSRLKNMPTGGEKSSGLGLAICKQLVEAHGGEIGVSNNPDCGTTFWFSLPVQD